MDKRYDHQTFETKAQELWQQEGTYSFTPQPEKELFSIDTPPPTVSGALHIGHLFSYTHTDLIARYKRMRGFNVFYPMGFDDNGLPTERYVEKTHKTKAHLHKRSDFIAMCLKESAKVEQEFEKLWRSIGLSVDWQHTYSTISEQARKVAQYSFLDLHSKKLIYRKEEPALYCTTCRTSVAQAELEAAELSSTFNDIEFAAEDGTPLVIATTRPELLPACVAVFFHPGDERYKHLEGKEAITPIFEKHVKILADKNVDKDKGTGLVMCCTFGDQADITWYKEHKLPHLQVVGLDGKWTAAAGVLEGLRVHEARKKVLELLGDAGKLLEQKKITHAVSVHERCKQEIEYQILPQWFVNILEHQETLYNLSDKISWYPGFMKARYKDWVGNLGWDWCISRQRFFGIAFPAWHCKGCSHVVLAEAKDLPIDPQEQKYPGGSCPKCSSEDLTGDTDVMDTWFTSSLTPQLNCRWPDEYAKTKGFPTIPMSMRPQAHDIIRTWALYTIIKAYNHQSTIPWQDIVISGHVLAGKGKISKSQGGAKLTPETLLAEHSADAVRYWTAHGKLGTDTAFSENQIKVGSRLVTKLWNAFRFAGEHLEGYERPEVMPPLDAVNQWLCHQFYETFGKYVEHFDEYAYDHALEDAERFFWHTFCDNYLELIKDRLFNPGKYSDDQIAATKFVLHEIGFGILQLFAPFVPHVTETIYQLQYLQHEDVHSLHATSMTRDRYDYASPEAAQLFETIVDIIAAVRKLKSEKSLSLKTELASLNIYTTKKDLLNNLGAHETLLLGITQAKEIEFINEKCDEQSSIVEKNGAWLMNVMI